MGVSELVLSEPAMLILRELNRQWRRAQAQRGQIGDEGVWAECEQAATQAREAMQREAKRDLGVADARTRPKSRTWWSWRNFRVG